MKEISDAQNGKVFVFLCRLSMFDVGVEKQILILSVLYAHQTMITKWAFRPHRITYYRMYCLNFYRFFLLWLLHNWQWQIMDRRFM